ncbi:MAG TPA: GNAT family N-acetyltransferase [Vicinamibacteria bacterium]|nr:GNAT family N-acetyltransferase [Vicinamibacteria bacterium]
MLVLRAAREADVPLILQLIRELAAYEREPDAVTATEEDLRRDGFGATPRFKAVIAEWHGEPAGFAFYFYNYSTWQGRPGLYLEDLFVRPAHRGRGIGKALLVHLAKVAVAEGCGRYQWQVLDWNTPAIEFYERMGGKVHKEWLTVRVAGDGLRALAARDDGKDEDHPPR